MTEGRFAIILSYVHEQNEPSQPCKTLLFLPEDKEQREITLIECWREVFADDDPEFTPQAHGLVVDHNGECEDYPYYDVSVGDGENHMLLTFIDNDLHDLARSKPIVVADWECGDRQVLEGDLEAVARAIFKDHDIDSSDDVLVEVGSDNEYCFDAPGWVIDHNGMAECYIHEVTPTKV